MSEDKIYEEILEWDRAKKALKETEDEVFHTQGSSHQMMTNSRFAHALRLIMESLEVKT